MLERIRRCRHCGREIEGSPLAYEENPFCRVCLDERTRAQAREGTLVRRGRYAVFIPREPERSSSND